MYLLALLSVVLGGATVGLLIHAIRVPRLRAEARVRQIATYGFGADTASSVPVRVISERTAQPLTALAGRLGAFIVGRLGDVREEALRKELVAAGFYDLSPRVLLGYRALATVGLGALMIASNASLLFVLAASISGFLAPLVFVRRKARFRLDEIERSLPELVDLLVVTIEAGLGFGAALQTAAAKIRGPLADELRLTLQEQRMGLTTREALEHLLDRVETPSVRSFVRTVVQGEELGVSIGTSMRNLAGDMRLRRRQLAEEQAQKAPTKMLFPLVFLIMPALGIVLLGPAAFELVRALGTT